jgi:hypothetical protein
MRKNGVHQLFLARFEIHRDDEPLDQFGNFGANMSRFNACETKLAA